MRAVFIECRARRYHFITRRDRPDVSTRLTRGWSRNADEVPPAPVIVRGRSQEACIDLICFVALAGTVVLDFLDLVVDDLIGDEDIADRDILGGDTARDTNEHDITWPPSTNGGCRDVRRFDPPHPPHRYDERAIGAASSIAEPNSNVTRMIDANIVIDWWKLRERTQFAE